MRLPRSGWLLRSSKRSHFRHFALWWPTFNFLFGRGNYRKSDKNCLSWTLLSLTFASEHWKCKSFLFFCTCYENLHPQMIILMVGRFSFCLGYFFESYSLLCNQVKRDSILQSPSVDWQSIFSFLPPKFEESPLGLCFPAH